MPRRNPIDELEDLREENADLQRRIDRVSGIARAADEIDSEAGLRKALDLVWEETADADESDADDEDFDEDEDED
jgi:hypothetical protein